MDLGANDQLRAAVDEALARPPAEQVNFPPPSLIISGLALEVNPTVFQGQRSVVITVKNHVAAASCPITIEGVDQVIAQLETAKAQALGLDVPARFGLVKP
jgi:hypothetical protein